MTLEEVTTVPAFDLNIDGFRAHLRLGTGFSDDDATAPVLEACLRAALAAIEARTGKVLLQRRFRWSLAAWRSPGCQAMPVAPVTEVTGVQLLTRQGDAVPLDVASVVLTRDSQRPTLTGANGRLPTVPVAGRVEITFDAGFATTFTDLPADLAQAVRLLAAHYFEVRAEQPMNDGNMPFGVSTLIARYRTVRILGGVAR